MKKRLICIASTLIMLMNLGTSAMAVTVEEEPVDTEAVLVSVETVSNSELDDELPIAVRQALGESVVAPFNHQIPSSSSVWDLTEDGQRNFHAFVDYTAIYSSFCYTGHDGAVKLYVYEDTEELSGETFKFQLYERGLIDTRIYTFECFFFAGNGISRVDGFDSDALIYFKIPADLNGQINITSDSYIAKAR